MIAALAAFPLELTVMVEEASGYVMESDEEEVTRLVPRLIERTEEYRAKCGHKRTRQVRDRPVLVLRP